MSLEQQLGKRRTPSAVNIPAQKYDIMQRSTKELQEIELSKNAFKKGQTIPSFELTNASGVIIKSVELLRKGPLVISFYRGGWCPYCNMELRALQKVLDQIHDLGAELVAISPETPDNSLTTSEKNTLSFEVLSDIENIFARQLGLVFQMPEDLREVYHSFNLDVQKHNGNDDYELPMPATYVIDTGGKIILDFVPEDYTHRLEPEDVLKALRSL